MTSTSFNVGMTTEERPSSKATSSSSDSESDEDYVPSSKELKDDANDDDAASSDDIEDSASDDADASATGGVKRPKRSQRKRKKIKKADQDETPEEEPPVEEKQPSKNIDEIWSSFKKEVESEMTKNPKARADPEEAEKPKDEPKTKKVTEIFEFAGEAVAVEKEVPVDAPEPQIPKSIPTTSAPGPRRAAGGLSSILGQIGKKNKLSILEKSKLDWNTFKKQEGIEEQLQTHNKGKDGFLEKQDFLQRTDLRQFEIEKAMRSSSRRSK